MKIFRWSDPILLPLAPTITGTIAAYLRLMSDRVYVQLSRNCDNLAPELPTDGSWFWQCQQSIKSVPTSQYQYVSTIAHRLAPKSGLTPLEICQIWPPPIRPHPVDVAAGLELGCWYNTAGYLYFQLTPAASERWLGYLDRLPALDRDRLATHCPVTGTSESALAIALYAHARCCSLLKLAHREKSIALSADWHIDPANWFQYGREDRQRAGSIGIFDRPVERQLIQSLMAVVDAIYGDGLSSSLPTSTTNSSSNRSPRGTPNWSKLTIDLAQSWLAFHRDCRIFGEIKLQNPHLAIARCGLTAIVRRYLQILLEGYLGVSAVEEL